MRRGDRGQRRRTRVALRAHRHRRRRPARLGPRRRPAHRGRRHRRPAAVAADRPPWSPCRGARNEHSARRRPEDHLVRRERRRPRRTPTSRAPTRRSSPTPPATCARAPARNVFVGVDGRLLHAAAVVGLPGRHHPRAGARAGRRRSRSTLPIDALRRGRRGVPHVEHPRRAADRARSTAAPLPAVPGPAHRPRRATPSPPCSPATSIPRPSDPRRRESVGGRRWTTSPATTVAARAVAVVDDAGARRR